MDTLMTLLAPVWGYVVAAVVVVGGLAVARSSGRKAQKQETEAKVAQQQGESYRVIKEVRDELDKAGPGGSRDRSKRWVRPPDTGGE